MHYLTLRSDHGGALVTSVDGTRPELDELPISQQLLDDLARWGDDYKPIVWLPSAERAEAESTIGDLDRRGVHLAGRMEAELQPAKVGYISEGTGQRLKPT